MKELCANTSCNHPRDMHASLGGYCSICGCNRFYVNIKLSGDGSSVGAIVTNEQGGSQSKLDFDFTQLDADMLKRVAKVLNTGAKKYGEKNWQKIPFKDHVNHMIYHAIMANTSDTSEDHLANTICRAMFAMWSQQNDLVAELEANIDELAMGYTASSLADMVNESGVIPPRAHWVLEPPFGYRKLAPYPSDIEPLEPIKVGFMPGSRMGYVTEPQPVWCIQCPHDAKDHIITPNIEGDCLVCAKCGCRQQLLEDDTWCQTCKHPMSHHKDNIDVAVCECSCIVAIAEDPPHLSEILDTIVDEGLPVLPENICKCGHHLIAHQPIGTYRNPARGLCRNVDCPCLKFDPSTEAKSDLDKPSRSRPYGPLQSTDAPQGGNTDKTVSP